jgi:RNA polymerase sigma-70 factor, ECF subfamily
MEQGSDLVLFQRIRENDRLALNTLFKNYYANLCRFAGTFSIGAEQAEELVADVFYGVWKNRDRLVIHSNGKAYLYKAVRNAALAERKRHVREVGLLPEHDLHDYNTPERQLQYSEFQEQIDQVVATLPNRCQQIFIMNRFDGLKYREISQVLNISEKTVEHQMVKALEIMRTVLRMKKPATTVHNSIIVS